MSAVRARHDPPRIMKLILGPENLQTEFEFTLYKQVGPMFYNDSKLLSMKHYSVGAYVSGGLDSTIMLCMMLTELRNINRLDIPVTCFTITKSDGPTFYATQVIKKVEEKFSVKLIHKKIGRAHV